MSRHSPASVSSSVTLGELTEGEQVLRRAMELYETFDEAVGKASVRRELADLLTKSGRLKEARPLLDEAEKIFAKLHDRFGKAITSNSYGAWYLASGQPPEARRRYTEALELALEIASPLEGAAALAGLARVAKALGEHRAAEQGLRDALAIYESFGAGEAAELARELEPE
jgi:tetratricopeptide (TPR) repeat protein